MVVLDGKEGSVYGSVTDLTLARPANVWRTPPVQRPGRGRAPTGPDPNLTTGPTPVIFGPDTGTTVFVALKGPPPALGGRRVEAAQTYTNVIPGSAPTFTRPQSGRPAHAPRHKVFAHVAVDMPAMTAAAAAPVLKR